NISTADNTGFSLTAPWHRHSTGNAHRQSAWLPCGWKSSDGLLWGCGYRRHLWRSLEGCIMPPIALSYAIIFILTRDDPHGLRPWGLTRARVMSQLSKVQHSRHQWKHKATQRGDYNRYQRKQSARL